MRTIRTQREERIAERGPPLREDLKAAIRTDLMIFGARRHPDFATKLVETLSGMRPLIKGDPFITAERSLEFNREGGVR